MTDGLRIAHPQDCPLEGNPEVGYPSFLKIFIESQIFTIHDNLFYLTIKSDTGQHSQFLRCFITRKSEIEITLRIAHLKIAL